MEEIKKGYRMYFFVPYNISDIQKAIQAGHCAEQYALDYGDDPEWREYVMNHKTWVILDGGTFNSSQDHEIRGSLNKIVDEIVLSGIKFATFYEPDLNDGLTAVCFIADEKVYDGKNYPHWDDYINQKKAEHHMSGLMVHKIWPEEPTKEYIDMVGGAENWFKKQLIYKKRLA